MESPASSRDHVKWNLRKVLKHILKDSATSTPMNWQDEDHLAIKKKKARTLNPRDKWSLLRFIPSQALNSREEGSTGVEKGKRLWFDRFNQLSFKVYRKAFHKFLCTWALLEAGDSIMRKSKSNDCRKIIELIIGR